MLRATNPRTSHLSRNLAGVALAALLLAPSARAQYAIAQGPDPAVQGRVKVYDGAIQHDIQAFTTGYGAHVAFSDMTNDDHADVIAGAGPGSVNAARVRGFQVSGTPVAGLDFMAYGTGQYGAQVAGVELPFTTGEEVVTLPGLNAPFGPQVRAWSYTSGNGVMPVGQVNYFLSSMIATRATLSHGDFNADGYEEVLTAEKTGLGNWITATSFVSGQGNLFRSLLGGVSVHPAGGNLDAGPADELLLGVQNSSGGPQVRGFYVQGGALTAMSRVNFIPDSCTQCGARPAVGDLDGDSYDEILVSPTTGKPAARAFNFDGNLLTYMWIATAYQTGSYGGRPAISDSLF